MTHREGIEIDYCPACRGVWLDRGELDKLIERSAAPTESTTAPRNQSYAPSQPRPRYDDDDHEHRYRDEAYSKRKRKGFLGELFDFD